MPFATATDSVAVVVAATTVFVVVVVATAPFTDATDSVAVVAVYTFEALISSILSTDRIKDGT